MGFVSNVIVINHIPLMIRMGTSNLCFLSVNVPPILYPRKKPIIITVRVIAQVVLFFPKKGSMRAGKHISIWRMLNPARKAINFSLFNLGRIFFIFLLCFLGD